MKFLIQTINGQVVHDFCFHLLEAIRYQRWYDKNSEIDYQLSETHEVAGCVPVGSVEFVCNYLEKYFDKRPEPRNIPPELWKPEFLHRKVEYSNGQNLEHVKFVKSAREFHKFKDFVWPENQIPEDEYIISDVIEIESEWRAFIHRKQIRGLQNYSGDFLKFPNPEWIQTVVNAWINQPCSWTLDIGLHEEKNFIIEVHDFFSCGLYGFVDARILPQMFSQWFYEYVRKKV